MLKLIFVGLSVVAAEAYGDSYDTLGKRMDHMTEKKHKNPFGKARTMKEDMDNVEKMKKFMKKMQKPKPDEGVLSSFHRGEFRSLGGFITSTYSDSTEFTQDSKDILDEWNFRNKNLVKSNEAISTVAIKWTQASRCWWSCGENYKLVKYYEDGDTSNPSVTVFVAEDAGSPPSSFNTGGYSGSSSSKLHFGYTYVDDIESVVIFFVIHPNSWGPYQHRFVTSWLTASASLAIKTAVSAGIGAGLTAAIASAAAAGGAIGSVIPGPGTVAGAALGVSVAVFAALFSQLSDDYVGDYLRLIGG